MNTVCKLGIAAGLVFTAMPAAAQNYGAQPYGAMPGVQAAVRAASRADRDLRAFYEARGFRPLWLAGSGPTAAVIELIRLIDEAALDGLDPASFDPDRLHELVERADSPRSLARADVALSRAFVRYAGALRQPRNVGTIYLDKELAPRIPSAGALLTAAATAPSLRDHVAGMGWMNPIYADLRRGLASSRASRTGRAGITVPATTTLRPGSSGASVWYLRQRLALPAGGAYDRAVAAAVAEFQEARGLPVDGVAGPRTILALNEASPDRDGLVRLNMERARVLPADPGRRYILVDAAGARLWMYENGRVQDSMKVVVGKPGEATPMLAGLMHYAIVNPYWNVPPDLARTKVAPGVLAKGVGFLKSMRYEVLSDWTEKATVLDPKTVDWRAVAAGRSEVRVRQLPGKGNSMGRMKFMMPNDLGIYLHDTPDRHLFADANRYFSSGCVRLEDAPRLAKWLFGKPLTAASKDPEQRVDLPEPVPVYITYLTAAPTAQGLAFRNDIYGRDRPGAPRTERRSAGLEPAR
ncbi:MAG TPA: L,D-transpeptidase family protein [Sphingomonadaceae bacterium]|nr:L,D-transpeptidase family protein [Sphingomonadaceae bacterium]